MPRYAGERQSGDIMGFWESVDALGIRITQVNIVTVRTFDTVTKVARASVELVKG
jgi:hypothetical protein